MFVIQFMKMEGEHSNPLRNISVFANEVLNKNYINISIVTNIKSAGDIFCTHIVPWNIPSPFASMCCIGPSRV